MLHDDITIIRDTDTFIEGFRLGARVVLDVVGNYEGQRNHCHVKCNICGRIFDVDMDFVTGLEHGIRDTHGFDFIGYDILFHGVCPECKKQQDSVQK